MELIDIIIIILAVAAVIGVIAAAIYRKKKGISGCGCDCGSCGGNCASCHSVTNKTEEKSSDNSETPACRCCDKSEETKTE